MRYAIILSTLLLTGCAGQMISPAMHDIVEIMKTPAIQATIKDWTANTDMTNPSIGFYMVTGGELRAGGIVIRGSANGAADGGLDPQKMATLSKIAAEYEASHPATQPIR